MAPLSFVLHSLHGKNPHQLSNIIFWCIAQRVRCAVQRVVKSMPRLLVCKQELPLNLSDASFVITSLYGHEKLCVGDSNFSLEDVVCSSGINFLSFLLVYC